MRFLIAAVFTLVLALPQPAEAERRVALIIGNDNYAQVTRLEKAVNDANAVAGKLRGMGFEVVAATDADRDSVHNHLNRFVAGIQAGDVALVFFAGHGVEIDGQNYLLPVDLPNLRAGDSDLLKSKSISLSWLLDELRRSGASTALAIIDACRDNPFLGGETENLGRTIGLGRIAAPEGTFVIFSAGAGQQALDRLSDTDPDPNSVFTRSLLPLIDRPGLGLRTIAVELRRNVRRLAMTVAHPQTPAYYDEMLGDFAFAAQDPSPQIFAPKSDEVADPVREAFYLTKEVNTEEAWRAFLAHHGNRPDNFYVVLGRSVLVDLARGKPVELAENRSVIDVPGPGDCDWLAAHPDDPDALTDGVYVTEVAAEEAIAACREAAERHPDTPRFLFQLGRALHLSGDSAGGLYWYQKAVDLGYRAAMNNMGYLYRDGQGVAQDHAEAIRWHRKAADLGLPIAMHEIGKMYAGGLGVERDYAEALRWYRRAADAGHIWAIYSIGNLYQDGEGVPQDHAESLKWFRLAAERGLGTAMNRVGFYYAKGLGVAQDHTEAAAWFLKAVEAGDLWGIKNLGEVYERGYGVAQDTDEAAKWYATALSSGHQYTLDRLIQQPDKFEPGTIRALQKMLRDGGYYHGALDADVGPGTVAALQAFFEEGAKPGGN